MDKFEEEMMDQTLTNVEGMIMEENKVGDYECSVSLVFETKYNRTHMPWMRGVIIKLLGKWIRYKVIETRLKYIWVRKGVISIIDLSNDYFLVDFFCMKKTRMPKLQMGRGSSMTIISL